MQIGDSLKTTQYNFNFNSKHIHENPNWKQLEKTVKNFKFLTPASNSQEASSIPVNDLTNYISAFLNERTIVELMEETKLTGTLNVDKPALYIFPASEGDCSLFTFNGYSVLVDGGYDRINPAFWRFVSMLKQIDLVMFTRQEADSLGGLSSLFAKKLVQPNVRPNLLSIFGNLVKSKNHDASLNDADIISDAIDELKLKIHPLVKHDHNNLKPHQQPEHINLYFKHGYGSLDMYVLSPFANSSEYKEFVHQTNSKVQANVHKSHLNVNQTFKNIPVSHLCSAVVLLAWTPSKSGVNAIRILYTGNAPQHVIAHALDKVKDFDLLQAPVYKIKESVPAHNVKKAHASIKINDAEKAVVAVQNDAEKKQVNKQEKTEKATNEHAKIDKTSQNATTNATAKPATNGAVKPSTSAAASNVSTNGTTSKPPSAANAKPATATNGTVKRESTANNNIENNTKKAEAIKKPVATSTLKDEQHKEEKEAKKSVPTAAARPPVQKKEETKTENKKEKTETTTRASIAPGPSKSEHNTKATTSTLTTAQPVPVKQRPSSAKPNVKPEKDEKDKKTEAPKKPVASAPPKPPTKVTENKGKSNQNKEKTSKASSKSEAKKDEKPIEEAKSTIVDETVATLPDTAACEAVYSTRTVEQPILVGPNEVVLEVPNESQEKVVEPKSDNIDSLLINIDNQTNGDFHDQEDVRKEVTIENKFDFDPSECVPFDLPNEKAENYVDENIVTENNILISEQDDAIISFQPIECESNNDLLHESPALSPIRSNENIEVLQETEIENQGCRRENLELCLDDQPLVVEPQELIKTPEHSGDVSPIEEKLATNEDIMTRSFIDNGENQGENPFLASNDKSNEDSTSNDNSLINDSGAVVEEQEPTTEFEGIINGIKSMNIQHEVTNGEEHHNGHNGHHENGQQNEEVVPIQTAISDPTTWTLLELPKPVNPNEAINGATATTQVATNNANNSTEKKPTTPNSKQQRGPPVSSSSPATASTSTSAIKKEQASEPTKSTKSALNTSVSKSTSVSKPPLNNSTKSSPIHPLYFEVSYIPAHGNPYYLDSDFFKRVRARFYVLSSIEPTQHVLNALLDAKQTWEDKELQVSNSISFVNILNLFEFIKVTLVPTYESDALHQWFTLNAEQLARHKIDILPAANLTRLTIDNNSDIVYQVQKLEF